MTQEVEEFLKDPDADKADKLTLEQKLEAWDEIKKEGSAYNDESEQSIQLQGATETYLTGLKSSDIDKMSPADLEGLRSLVSYSSLRDDVASRISGNIEYAEKKLALDGYLADIEAKYPDRADEIPYMDAYLKRQLDNDYGRDSDVLGGLDGRKDVLDMVDMAAHEYNGVSVPLPEELQETVENMRTTSRRMLDQEYDETMDTVLADAMGEEAVSHVEIVKMVEYAQTFSRGEDGKYIGEVGEWINAVNETRANNGLEPLESIDYVDIKPVENTHNAEFTTEDYMQMLESNEGNEGVDAFREFLERRNSETNTDEDSSTGIEQSPEDLLHTNVAVARWIEQTRSSMTPEIAAAADEYMAKAKQNFAEMGARVENGDILEYTEELHNIWESDNDPNIHAALEQVEELFGDEGKAFMQTYNEYKELNGEEAITPRQQEEQTAEQQPTAGYDAENFDDVEYAGYVRDGVAEEYGTPGTPQNTKQDEEIEILGEENVEDKGDGKPIIIPLNGDENAEEKPAVVEPIVEDERMAAVDGVEESKDDSAGAPVVEEESHDDSAGAPVVEEETHDDSTDTPVVEEETVELADNTDAYMAHLDEVIEAGGEDGRKAQAFKDMLEGRADEGSMAERLQRQTDIMDWYQQDTYAINDDGEEHPGEFGKETVVGQKADAYLDEIAKQAQTASFQQDVAFFNVDEKVVLNYVDRLNGIMELPQDENAAEGAANLGDQFLDEVNSTRVGISLDAIIKPVAEDSGKPVAEDSGKPAAEDSGKPETEDSGKPETEDSGKPEDKDKDKPEAEDKDKPEDKDKDKPEEEKSEERKEVEEYLDNLPTTEIDGTTEVVGLPEYKEYMLVRLKQTEGEEPNYDESLSKYVKIQKYLDKHAANQDDDTIPTFIRVNEASYTSDCKNWIEQTTEKEKTEAAHQYIIDTGVSYHPIDDKDSEEEKDNKAIKEFEDVKAFDEFMDTFGKGPDGNYTEAAQAMIDEVDEKRTNNGQMSLEEALFLANTDEEELKNRDGRAAKLFESPEMQDLLTNDPDLKKFETFYDNVEIDLTDIASNEWIRAKEKLKSSGIMGAAPVGATMRMAAEEEHTEETTEEETTEAKKEKRNKTGADLRKDIYDLAVAKAMRDIMQEEDLGKDENELSEEQKQALREKMKGKIAEYMMETTMSILTTQYAQNTYVSADGQKLDDKGQQARREEIALKLFGKVVEDPAAMGKVHLSEKIIGTTLGAQMAPITDFKNKLERKIGKSKLVTRIKELDNRFEKKYGFCYKLAKNFAKTAVVNYTLGLPGLAVKTAYETGKAIKKFNDEYQQQKKAGGDQSIWKYMAHNKVKTASVVAAGIGAGVSAYLGIDAAWAGNFGAVGDWIKGGAETAQAAVAQSASLIDKVVDYGKNFGHAFQNLVTGNSHAATATGIAKMIRASASLTAGMSAAASSFNKGKWKEGLAAFTGSALGALMTMVSNEVQAEHLANIPSVENTGSGAPQLGQETGGLGSATQGGAAEGLSTNNEPPLIYDPKTGQMVPNPKFSDLSDATKGALNTPIVPETPEETIAKAEQTIKNVDNFHEPKAGLKGGRVDIGAKAPKIEVDDATKEAMEKPIPKVPEDYQGNGGKGGSGHGSGGGNDQLEEKQENKLKGQEEKLEEKEEKLEEKEEEKGQKQVIDEHQEETVVEVESMAVELDDPKDVRVDETVGKTSLKITTASNGVQYEYENGSVAGEKEEIVSAINKETGLRRTVRITYDEQGQATEEEMTDKEARKFAKNMRKADNAINKEEGGATKEAEKTYKAIKRASSTELRRPKPVVPLHENEDGTDSSLTRGRNGFQGDFTLKDGQPAQFSIIKDRDGTVHYVVTEKNGHQRLMTEEERNEVKKQIEESGNKKAIRKLHKLEKKPMYEAPQEQSAKQDLTSELNQDQTLQLNSDVAHNSISFTQGNKNLSMSLDENGRAHYEINGKPMSADQIKEMNVLTKASLEKAGGVTVEEKAFVTKVNMSQQMGDLATQKIGMDNASMKINVTTNANGGVETAAAVSKDGAVYSSGKGTEYMVVDEHKQLQAYRIVNNKSVQLNAQETATLVNNVSKQVTIDRNSDLGKAINNAAAVRAASTRGGVQNA